MSEPMNIQWYPGHMAKAKRMMAENLKLVDAVCEIVDARIPISSRNPDLPVLIGQKPLLVVFNRSDQADPRITALWRSYLSDSGVKLIETDSKTGRGISGFPLAVKELLAKRLEQYRARGQGARPIRVMVAGIPNVGKSTFINKAAKRKAAGVSDRPGVTRGKQWISTGHGLELLDTPGILWPRIGCQETGEALAYTGAIRDEVLDMEILASRLMMLLREEYPECLVGRYGISLEGESGFELLEAAAAKRGFLIQGGRLDTLRMAAILLDEFRGGQLGRISLEKPSGTRGDADERALHV